MRSLNQIKKDIYILRQEQTKFLQDQSLTFEEWSSKTKPIASKLNKLFVEKSLQVNIKWSELPDYGNLMTLQDFLKSCKEGSFIDYDGHGKFSDGKRESNINIYPSHITEELKIRSDIDSYLTHVIWYNK